MGASSSSSSYTIFYFLIICYSQLLLILLILSQISQQLIAISSDHDDDHVSHHLHFVKNVIRRSDHDVHHNINPEQQQLDFSEWLEWNAKDYKQKTTSALSIFDHNNNAAVPASSSSSSSSFITVNNKYGDNNKKKIDHKLAKAEANKVYLNVSSKNGSGSSSSSSLYYFASIREALQSIEGNNTRRVIIRVAPGIYREKIVLPKRLRFISLVGDDDGGVVITGNDTAASLGENGIPMKTFHSATVAVNADYFVAINIKFENTAPYPDVGVVGGQAVALRISGNKAAFYNCSFYGTQDTLYDHKGLHYFNNCFIQGSVDFIFGYGRSLYQGCSLNSIAKNVSALTAQKRNNNSLTSGFSFINSSIAGSGLVYLGRAWGDHSRVVFSYTYMDNVVIPEGWNDWGDPQRESSVYYGEYKCEGPGANMTGRVHWARVLTDEEAIPFLGTYYVDGDKWLLTSPI